MQLNYIKDKNAVPIGNSTFAYVVPDYDGVLDDGEIHVLFSKPFRDSKTGYETQYLHNIDCLVSRLPAHSPWHIQRVRASFKPNLGHLRDVVVF